MMKKYQKYKPSNVDFIGDIPEGWEVRRLATIGSFYKGKGISKDLLTESGEPAILYGEIYTKYDFKTYTLNNFISAKTAEKSFQIKKNDLLFTGSGETEEDIGKCITYLGNDIAYAGGDVIVLRPNSENSLFLSYVLNSQKSIYQKIVSAKGDIIVHIYSSTLKEILFTLPPLKEQEKIANFLDTKNRQIEEFIKDKETQIALLQEQKEAIIDKAVTKGLDDSVEFKNSGIEWIGDIPKSWNVKKLKYSIKLSSGMGLTSNDIESEGLYKVYGGNGKIGYYLDFNAEKDLLIIGRVGAKCGNIHIVNEKIWITDNALIVKTSENYKYMYYYLTYLNLNKLSTSTAQPLITGTDIKNYKVALPEVKEQNLILKYIETQTTKIDKLINQIQKECDLIKEYKISLISEVVTGQIDVR